MKQLIAENRVTVNKKLFMEGSDALRSQKSKKILRIIILILAVLFSATAIWLVSQGGSLIFTIGEFLFISFLILWIFVIMPRNKSATKFKLMARNTSDGTLTRTTQFFSTYLLASTETGKTLTIPYKDIASWLETRHLWVLVSKNHQAIMLGKDSFTQGSMEEVKKAAGLN